MSSAKANRQDNVPKKKKRLLLIFFLLFSVPLVLLAFAILIPNAVICSAARPYIKESNNVEPAQVVIVPGCYVDDKGNLSSMLQDRVRSGIALYKAGKVKKILLTGDHSLKTYDEVNSMRSYAEKLGVPPEDLFMDHAGFTTYESMYRARDVFHVKSAIITTQGFHLPRSVYIARRMGLSAVGVNADRLKYDEMTYNLTRETLARVKAFIQVNITRPKPTFLGEVIPITGDGRATHDLIEKKAK